MRVYTKKIYSFLLLFSIVMNAQIGITGNNPNKDAILDLNTDASGNNKGILLPKVALIGTTDATPLSAHVAGMHVYNTASAGSGITQVTPGEYYNDGSKWNRIQSNLWELSGNSNTNQNEHFIGTTDMAGLNIVGKNISSLYLPPDGGIVIGSMVKPNGYKNAVVMTSSNMQILDGTQALGKVLTSDDKGIGTWEYLFDNGTVSGTFICNTAQTFNNAIATTLLTATPLLIQKDGSYLVTVRWRGKSDGPDAKNNIGSYFELYKNGVKVDEVEYYLSLGAASNIFSFNVDLQALDCKVNDVLTIKLTPLGGVTSCKWYTGTSGLNASWMPSVLLMRL